MTYWTVMIITVLGGYLDGADIAIPYPDLASCEAALTAVSSTLPYDHSLVCEETTVASASIRPMPRPADLAGEAAE